MSIVKSIWAEEIERVRHIYEVAQKTLEEYPKGSIQVKKINSREYAYLCWREEGGKVHSKYIGRDPQVIEKVRQDIATRNEREKAQRRLKQDIHLLERALRLKTK